MLSVCSWLCDSVMAVQFTLLAESGLLDSVVQSQSPDPLFLKVDYPSPYYVIHSLECELQSVKLLVAASGSIITFGWLGQPENCVAKGFAKVCVCLD